MPAPPPGPRPIPGVAGSKAPAERLCTLYVGKIPAGVDDDELRQLLQCCGSVVKWKRQVDPASGAPKAFGFCDYSTGESVLRAMRLLRSYHVLTVLRAQSRFFRQHELVIFSATHLLVFVFVVSAAVYALQARVNDQINNYVDALYFTVTTLTTTGFGDIVMVGPTGRVLSVLIMIVGVSLFLRLIQAIFRPPHVDHECPDCGLTRHDIDAVHCKHCGRLLHIRTQGADE